MSEPAPVVVAVAENGLEANLWLDALHRAGIRASTFERGHGGALGATGWQDSVFPVLVAPGDLGHARSVIADLGGARALAPVRQGDEGRGGPGGIVVTIVVAIVLALVLGLTIGRLV